MRADTRPALTLLAIAAAVAHALLTIVGLVYLIGVAAGCLGAIAILATAAGLPHVLLYTMITVCFMWSFGALWRLIFRMS